MTSKKDYVVAWTGAGALVAGDPVPADVDPATLDRWIALGAVVEAPPASEARSLGAAKAAAGVPADDPTLTTGSPGGAPVPPIAPPHPGAEPQASMTSAPALDPTTPAAPARSLGTGKETR